MKRRLRLVLGFAGLLLALPPLAFVGGGLARGRDLASAWRAMRAPAPEPVAQAPALADAPFGPPLQVGTLLDDELVEVSGLAASQRDPALLWALNDGGNAPRLYALGIDGALRAAFDVDVGAEADDSDWEDLASFRFEGTPFLLIADVGDNWSWRRSVRLWAVEEPDLAHPPARIAPPLRIELRYEDGPRDCEAAALDPADATLLLISKRTAPPVVYRAALAKLLRAGGGEVVAQRLVALTGLPPPTTERAQSFAPAMLHMPTALDLAPDGSAAVVLGYAEGWRFPRAPGESWAEAFARAPERIRLPALPLAEAVAYLGPSLYVTSEVDRFTLVRWRAPLVRLDPKPSDGAAP
jgi:hypothetical protein